MHRKLDCALLAVATGLLLACVADEPALDEEDAIAAILAQERTALDRWAQGDPLGYVDIDAEDVTYFDDIGAHTRIDGRASMRSYAASLVGKIPPHRYEVVNPKVQVYGDIGILTLRYHAYAADGQPLARWKATSVYRRTAAEWRIVHAHWSLVKGS
jgi:ketosteroid isomerase-like protein